MSDKIKIFNLVDTYGKLAQDTGDTRLYTFDNVEVFLSNTWFKLATIKEDDAGLDKREWERLGFRNVAYDEPVLYAVLTDPKTKKPDFWNGPGFVELRYRVASPESKKARIIETYLNQNGISNTTGQPNPAAPYEIKFSKNQMDCLIQIQGKKIKIGCVSTNTFFPVQDVKTLTSIPKALKYLESVFVKPSFKLVISFK